MFTLKDNFVVDLVSSKIEEFSSYGVSYSEFKEFLSNLPTDLIQSLPDSSKHSLGYYFNSYDYSSLWNNDDFYKKYSFVSEFESKYSLLNEVK